MSSNKLEKWALLAEIIGGIAIVISLGVVAFELNQGTKQAVLNTSALEIASYQDLIDSISNLNEIALNNPELGAAIQKSLTNPDDLSKGELRQTRFYFMTLFRHGDMAYFQYQRGAINHERLDSVLSIVTARLRSKSVLKLWNERKYVFVSDYRAYIDDVILRQTMNSDAP